MGENKQFLQVYLIYQKYIRIINPKVILLQNFVKQKGRNRVLKLLIFLFSKKYLPYTQ